MRTIETGRLRIRDWEEADRDLFHRVNSDEAVMRFFPFRRSKAQADEFFDSLRARNAERGYGFSALELKRTGECIGFAGLHFDRVVPGRPQGAVEIGWRLAPEHWGHGYVTEAARALLAFGFEDLDLDEIVSFAVASNEKSIAIMKRIGMEAQPAEDFDHPRVPDTHPQLRRHAFYRLRRDDWRRLSPSEP
jgi:RimJ/RimL family protein N-acetyltransferase